MCGLAGMAGDLGAKDTDIFKELLLVASLRGEDSAGVFSIPERSDTPKVLKVVGTPFDLFAHHQYSSTASAWSSRALVGHARKATVGSVTKYTAHPFHYDNIVGVHNGTLRNWRQALKVEGDYQVDSQKLFSNIAFEGVRETIEGLDGAYAMVWWDEDEKTLNFLRNTERSLYYAFNKGCTKMYWHSELWALRGIMIRNGIEMHSDDNNNSFFSVPEDIHFKWQLKFDNGKTKLVMVSNEELKGNVKPQPVVPFVSQYHRGYSREGSNGGNPMGFHNRNAPIPDPVITKTPAASPSTSIALTSSTPNPSETKNSVPQPFQAGRSTLSLVRTNNDNGSESSPDSKTDSSKLDDPLPKHLAENVKGYHGILLSRVGYDSTVDSSCQWCGSEVTFDEAIQHPPRFLDTDRILCHGCNSGALLGYAL